MKLAKVSSAGFSHLIIPIVVVALVAVVGTITLLRSHAATCTDFTYGYGSSGQCVKDIQYIVGQWTLDHPTIDGQFGPQTKAAVELYQSNHHNLTVDGVVGPNTWAQLCIDVNSQFKNPTAVLYAHNAGCE